MYNNYMDIMKEANSLYNQKFQNVDFYSDLLYKKYNAKLELKTPDKNISGAKIEDLNFDKQDFDFNLVIIDGFVSKNNSDSVKVYEPENFANELLKYKLFDNSNKYAVYAHAFSKNIIYIEPKEGEKINISINVDKNPYPIQLIINSSAEKATVNVIINSGKSKDTPVQLIMNEVTLGENSNCDLNILQLDGKSDVVNMLKSKGNRYSSLNLNESYFGNNITKEEAYLDAADENASVAVYKTVLGKEDQKFDIFTDIINRERLTKCNSAISAIVSDSSVCYCKDVAEVLESAKNSFSNISQKGLINDKTAHLDLMPDMSIKESYTKAYHSSYSSPIDEGDVFYLLSRGIDRKQAEYLIKEGFLSSNLKYIKDEKFRNIVINRIDSILKDKSKIYESVESVR